MTSRQIINRVVIGGRALSDPATKPITTKTRGDTVKTTFALYAPHGSGLASVRIEVEAWSTVATVAQQVTKGRLVIVDGRLGMDEYTRADGSKATRFFVRADVISLLDRASLPGADAP